MTKQNHDHIVDPTEKVQPALAPLPESVESALCVVALSEYPSVESVLRFHISDLTRRLAEAESTAKWETNKRQCCEARAIKNGNLFDDANAALTARAEAAEARATTAEQEAGEALAGAHAEQEVSRHWKQEAYGLKSIVDAAGKLHREIAEALGRKDMPTDLLVLTAKGLRARVADLESQLSGVGVRQYREAVEMLHKAEAERDALREQNGKLEWRIEVLELRVTKRASDPGLKRFYAACDEFEASLQTAIAATEVKP